jgi:hypothetical protein
MCILYLYMKIRKTSLLSLRPVQGLTVYMPPQDEDYDMLEKTNKKPRENRKGEVNKYDKKKVSSKAKFPLRTIQLEENFLKSQSEFFIEYDFFFMLFTVILVLFAITQTVKVFLPQLMETNVVFLMIVFVLLMAFMHLTRNTFKKGIMEMSDETKVEALFAVKAWIITFVFLSTYGSTTFFDFNMEKAHNETLERINQTAGLYGGKFSLPVGFTYSIMGTFAALISFATTRLNIRFAYYFYVLSKNRAQLLASKVDTLPEYKTYKRHLTLMTINLFSPLIVSLLYISPLVESLLVPSLLSSAVYDLLRVAFVISAIALRTLTFREEIQFHFNESYFYVQRLMIDKDEKIFRYIKLRITENYNDTWYAIFQHLCNFATPILLVLAYINRLVAFSVVNSLNLDFTKIIDKINAVGRANYDLISDKESISQIFSEMSAKGLFTFEYQEGIFSYIIFWYFLSSVFVFLFALLYYRKFVGE